jgi:hypothetical protein
MADKQLLLVDANVISHALTANQTPAYVDLLKELEQKYNFVVTGFTKYEITCSSDKVHRDKYIEFIEQNMGDVVNAAFAIAKPCDVLTIDNNDYPTPFFAEVARKRVSYKSKQGNQMTDVVCMLRPDVDNVKECFVRHIV